MEKIDFIKIKHKFQAVDQSRFWGDDFDVRFFLVSKIKELKNKTILDVGGGIGIIASELDESNFVVNLDLSLIDLTTCKKHFNKKIENICASMEFFPFKENVFDNVICAHILEVAKSLDIKNDKVENENDFPTVNNTLKEVFRSLKNNGILLLTTPNNQYYKTIKLSYNELKKSLENVFTEFNINFYNTYPRLSRKYRKMNMANVIPKLKLKIIDFNSIINSLMKQNIGYEVDSVAFYVEAKK